VVNAVVVALAANGDYDAVMKAAAKPSDDYYTDNE